MDKLSRIAGEAKRNGMSYGQLMAARYEQELEAGIDHEKLREERRAKRLREEGYVPCANELCGKMFIPRDKNNKYCCATCANTAYYARKAERLRIDRAEKGKEKRGEKST